MIGKRYMREVNGAGVQELPMEEWLQIAVDNTRDVFVAMRDGFSTAGARYWIEKL